MTTPHAPGQGVHTGSFGGYPFPPDVVAAILNLLISGAVFAPSLARQGTGRSSVAWPTAKPTGWAWLEELQPFPVIDVADDAYVVAVAKIGGIVDLSNEGFSDSSINMSAQLGDVLRDSLSRDLDMGLLSGGGPPAPVGVVGVAPEVAAADLHAAVTVARGQIGDAGGVANTLAALPSVLADADAQRSEGDTGVLVYPNGFAASLGLRAVGVPGIPAPLVYDATRCFLVVRDDPQVDGSRDWHFDRDAYSIRVKARIAAAIPDVPKAIRKLKVEPAARAAAARAKA